jgi:hypothetical protein
MQLTARLIQLLPIQTGTGRNGEWKRQDIIVETDGQYPKKICVSIWGDKVSPALLQTGKNLTIDFDVESREFNGRWYTDLRAWKVEVAGEQNDSRPVPPPSAGDFPEPPPLPANDQQDDLPF